MRHKKEIAVAPLGAVLCVCACLVGCERRQAVPSSPASAPEAKPSDATIEARAHDASYQAKLKQNMADQRNALSARSRNEARIEQLRELARQALPPGATDAQIEAELDGNPRKYPEWRERIAALKASEAEEEKLKAAAQATVRQRILRKSSGGGAQGAAPAEK